MNHEVTQTDREHHRTLSKWLNEEQIGPIDRVALAHVLNAGAQAQPAIEAISFMTDAEIDVLLDQFWGNIKGIQLDMHRANARFIEFNVLKNNT